MWFEVLIYYQEFLIQYNHKLLIISGSGKSTLISLIQSLHKPISGKIKIDGEDISHLESEWLRESISVVSQEPTLFTTTIR